MATKMKFYMLLAYGTEHGQTECDFFTNCFLRGILADQEVTKEIDDVIKHAIESTTDESKRLYLLTEFIKDNITGNGFTESPTDKIEDGDIRDYLDDIQYFLIDSYEIAKYLLNRYYTNLKKSA